MWDPLRAERDLQVGEFYLHKGDLDAAIDRFQDAALAKPGYAIPFRFLGEAQEKKGLKRDALTVRRPNRNAITAAERQLPPRVHARHVVNPDVRRLPRGATEDKTGDRE